MSSRRCPRTRWRSSVCCWHRLASGVVAKIKTCAKAFDLPNRQRYWPEDQQPRGSFSLSAWFVMAQPRSLETLHLRLLLHFSPLARNHLLPIFIRRCIAVCRSCSTFSRPRLPNSGILVLLLLIRTSASATVHTPAHHRPVSWSCACQSWVPGEHFGARSGYGRVGCAGTLHGCPATVFYEQPLL